MNAKKVVIFVVLLLLISTPVQSDPPVAPIEQSEGMLMRSKLKRVTGSAGRIASKGF